MFKGNSVLGNSLKILESFKEVGFYINAYTSMSKTVYHSSGLSSLFPTALTRILDLVSYPSFPLKEFVKEKQPILNELQIYNSDQTSVLSDEMYKHVLGNQVAHATLGNKENIENMPYELMVNFFKELYRSDNMTLIIEDKRSPKDIISILQEHSSYTKDMSYAGKFYLKNREDKQKKHEFPKYDIKLKNKADSSIVWLCSPASVDVSNLRQRFIFSLAQKCLTDILFDVIREKKGYPCYSVGAYLGEIHNAKYDINQVYCMVSPTKIEEVKEELRRLCLSKKTYKKNLTENFFNNVKLTELYNVIKSFSYNPSNFFLNSDKTPRIRSYDEVIEEYNQVTFDDVANVLDKAFNSKATIMVETKRN